MFQKLFLDWMFGMIGKRLDGYKVKIGSVAFILAGILQLIMALFPDLKIDGMERIDWDSTFALFRDGLAGLGVAFAGTGILHKAFKVGLEQPCPTEKQPTITKDEIDRRVEDTPKQKTPDALGDGEIELPQKWNGKVPGQFP